MGGAGLHPMMGFSSSDRLFRSSIAADILADTADRGAAWPTKAEATPAEPTKQVFISLISAKRGLLEAPPP